MSDHGTCPYCGNAGLVSVPHPQFVDKCGLWKPTRAGAMGPIYATVAVTCTCARGRKTHERMVEQGKKAMSLEQYREKVYHDPFELLEEIYPKRNHLFGPGPDEGRPMPVKETVRQVTKSFEVPEVPD